MRANTFKTFLLLGVLSAIVVAAGGALAPGALPILLGLTVAMNVAAWFFSERMVLGMNQARPLDPSAAPDLHHMVAELAARAGIPAPRLYLVDDPQPNAFATGRNPEHGVVAVTTGLVRMMPADELRGVIAHEIAHITHRDILVASVAAMLAGAVSHIGQALQFGVLFGTGRSDEDDGSPLGALVMAVVAPIAATLVQLGISRSREYMADELGARLTGHPESLARALERLHQSAAVIPNEAARPATASLFIVNPFSGAGGFTQLFSTHPPIEERVARLRALARRPRHLAA